MSKRHRLARSRPAAERASRPGLFTGDDDDLIGPHDLVVFACDRCGYRTSLPVHQLRDRDAAAALCPRCPW